MNLRALLVLATGVLAASEQAELCAQSAVPVSPGGLQRMAPTSSPCPTFSWGAETSPRVWELVVVPADLDRLDATTSPEQVAELRTFLPGTARAFTPAADRCLEPGGRYAWMLRSGDLDSDWSEPGFFFVERPEATAPSTNKAVDLEHHTTDEVTKGGLSRRAAEAPHGPIVLDRPLDPGDPSEPTRVAAASAPDPTDPASLTIGQNLRLATASSVFRDDKLFLWSNANNLALGEDALKSVGTGSSNSAFGHRAAETTNVGSDNVAVGYRALGQNVDGSRNTAVGERAAINLETGNDNTAVGTTAMFYLEDGFANTVVGASALLDSTGGDRNTAIGYQALENAIGNDLIGIGYQAGSGLQTGFSNILIGAPGTDESFTVRIGDPAVHQRVYVAGDLGLGLGSSSSSPTNRLHVEESTNATSLTPGGHVTRIRNISTGTNSDVLALQIASTTNPGDGNNFITFFDGNDNSLGAIEGNGGTSVVLSGSGADYAEWLPLSDRGESLEPGDVVGLFGTTVSKRTLGATRVFVVSTEPIVAGNDPGEEHRGQYARVAFVGQVEVRVRGRVRPGDVLVASGDSDGVAVAHRADAVRLDEVALVVGTALEESSSAEPGTPGRVRALVGLPGAEPWQGIVTGLRREVTQLRTANGELERRLERLEKAFHRETAKPTRSSDMAGL